MTKFSINEMAEPQCLGENSDLLVHRFRGSTHIMPPR